MFLFPQKAPNKATLFITIIQNTKQSEEDVLTNQNEVITQTKIWRGLCIKRITWRFLFSGWLKKLLTDPNLLQMVTINSGQKYQESNYLKVLDSEQKVANSREELKFRKELPT